MIKSIDTSDLDVKTSHSLFTSCISPRPIAWVSSIDKKGNVNISPFSYFNIFSTMPPILGFSPCLSGRDGSKKDTLLNIEEVPEVVINVVTFDLLEQMNITSASYPRGINEFVKARLTMLPSQSVKPPRVKESPVQMECRINKIISLGDTPGSGQLAICEVIKVHLAAEVLDENGKIDPLKINFMARGGKNYYYHAGRENHITLDKAE